MSTPTLLALIPGGYEWLIILAVVLVFFGNRIPGVARSLGSGITEFRKGLKDGDGEPSEDSGDSTKRVDDKSGEST
ncbi:MAG: sec-independent protein translocase protein TatA [Pseudohongiellaceae bacterium]